MSKPTDIAPVHCYNCDATGDICVDCGLCSACRGRTCTCAGKPTDAELAKRVAKRLGVTGDGDWEFLLRGRVNRRNAQAISAALIYAERVIEVAERYREAVGSVPAWDLFNELCGALDGKDTSMTNEQQLVAERVVRDELEDWQQVAELAAGGPCGDAQVAREKVVSYQGHHLELHKQAERVRLAATRRVVSRTLYDGDLAVRCLDCQGPPLPDNACDTCYLRAALDGKGEG